MSKKEDEQFYRDRIELLETEGWADLIDELKVLSDSVKRLESIDNEKDLWFARGQLSVLRQMLSLEDITKRAAEELDYV